ncbi:MAG TPA: hypothetical protein VHK90_10010 [Thermoanaerobaculia bacterium]|nr:hypothetical protein [Thermoanaerobaculia bacterium]
MLSLAVILLGACGTMDDGGIYGPSDSRRDNYEIRGTVDSIDLSSRSIFLTNVSGLTSMLSGGGGGSNVRVYYEDRTTVSYQGQTYRPQDLERGDQVVVRVDESGNALLAESMTVTHDVSGGSSFPSDTQGMMLRGTVRFVDLDRRTIELDRGFGSNVLVEYDASVPVLYNNRTYRVADLERGDEIEIRVRDLGGNRFLAQDITVTRSISAGGTSGGSSTQLSTVRGTVRFVDTTRRTIELESASWISGFNTGAGTGSRMVFAYDNNVGVDIGGQLHPVSGLERGDVIEVQFRNTSGTPIAERIFLVRDVRR